MSAAQAGGVIGSNWLMLIWLGTVTDDALAGAEERVLSAAGGRLLGNPG